MYIKANAVESVWFVGNLTILVLPAYSTARAVRIGYNNGIEEG